MSKKVVQSTIRWVMVLAWVGVIYFFSSQPNLRSGFNTTIDLLLRKLAHLAEYFVLAFLVFRAWQPLLKAKQLIIATIMVCASAAIFDEWHQTFVLGRSGNVIDVLVDMAGVLSYFVLGYFASHEYLRRH